MQEQNISEASERAVEEKNSLSPVDEERFKKMQALLIKSASGPEAGDAKTAQAIRMDWIYRNSAALRELVVKDPQILERYEGDAIGTRLWLEQKLLEGEPVN